MKTIQVGVPHRGVARRYRLLDETSPSDDRLTQLVLRMAADARKLPAVQEIKKLLGLAAE